MDDDKNDLGLIATPAGRATVARAVAAKLIPPPIEDPRFWETLRGPRERDVRNGVKPADLAETGRPRFRIRGDAGQPSASVPSGGGRGAARVTRGPSGAGKSVARTPSGPFKLSDEGAR